MLFKLLCTVYAKSNSLSSKKCTKDAKRNMRKKNKNLRTRFWLEVKRTKIYT